jgi:hypothetical protein
MGMYRYKVYGGSLYRKRIIKENPHWEHSDNIELYLRLTGEWVPAVLHTTNIMWDTTYVQALKFINQHRRH